ncbi:hypothetical protein ACWF94_14050 [Streptomyces sp. NPDC055078]
MPVPPVADLTSDQAMGRTCYACGQLLTSGAVHAGRARGRSGEHVLDAELWACPDPCP